MTMSSRVASTPAARSAASIAEFASVETAPEPPACSNAAATVVAQRTSSSFAARYLSKPVRTPSALRLPQRQRGLEVGVRRAHRRGLGAQRVVGAPRAGGEGAQVLGPGRRRASAAAAAGAGGGRLPVPGRGSGSARGGSARRPGRPAARPRRRRCPSPSRACCGRRAPSSTARATSRRCCSLRASSFRRRAPVATSRSAPTSSVASLCAVVWFVRKQVGEVTLEVLGRGGLPRRAATRPVR